MSRYALVIALVSIAAGSPARAAEPEPQAGWGFVLATDFSLSVFTFSGSGDISRSFGIQGGLFAGYKLDRVILGLGLDIQRIAVARANSGMTGMADTSSENTLLTIAPGIQVALLRSQSRKVELYAAFDVAWVQVLESSSPPPAVPVGSHSSIGVQYRVGPGVRYWIDPAFAFFVSPTLRGQFRWDVATASNGGSRVIDSTGVTTVDANIGFLGVF